MSSQYSDGRPVMKRMVKTVVECCIAAIYHLVGIGRCCQPQWYLRPLDAVRSRPL